MSKQKHKKRHTSGRRGYSITPVQESEFANDGKRKRMNPTARNLLFISLIGLAVSEILVRMEAMSELVSLVVALLALIALVAAIYLQFRSPDGSSHGRPRL